MVKVVFKDNGCASLFGGKLSPAGTKPKIDERRLSQEGVWDDQNNTHKYMRELQNTQAVPTDTVDQMQSHWLDSASQGAYVDVGEAIANAKTAGDLEAIKKLYGGADMLRHQKQIKKLLLKEIADKDGYITVYRGIRKNPALKVIQLYGTKNPVALNTKTLTSYSLSKQQAGVFAGQGTIKLGTGSKTTRTPGMVFKRKIHVDDVYDMPALYNEEFMFEGEVVVMNPSKVLVVPQKDITYIAKPGEVIRNKAKEKKPVDIDSDATNRWWAHDEYYREVNKYFRRLEAFIGESV